MARVRSAAVAVFVLAALMLLGAPAVAQAHGDPASDYLLVRSIFLPFDAKVDQNAAGDLTDTIREAEKAGFRIKVAVIGSRYDLGTAFSLYNKAQKYAEFLGLELSLQYKHRLLVVMPNGFGYSIDGRPDSKGIDVVKGLPGPGTDATAQVNAATDAIRRLAAASGHTLPPPGESGGGSETRDRLTIAAGVTALVALLAAMVFYRRERTAKT
jgi:hypothetical protein